MPRTLTFLIDENYNGAKLHSYLRGRAGVSTRIITVLKQLPDGMLLNGEHARTIDRVKTGDVLTVNLPDEAITVPEIEMPLNILYEDEDLLIINKPAGLAMHPTHNHQDDTLANGVVAYLAKQGKSGIFRAVGRLDKNTSGITVCALNKFSASVLSGGVSKEYLAIAGGVFSGSGVIDKRIFRPDPMKTLRACGETGEEAVTRWDALRSDGKETLLRVIPETGRTHQIRVHFSSLGTPLLGDDMYGGDCTLIQRHALHCAYVCFTHPVAGKKMEFHCEMPEDMQAIFMTGQFEKALP